MARYHMILRPRVSPRAYVVADWLIETLELQMGYGLARHLGYASYIHNYDAVRFWVQKELDRAPKRFATLGDAKQGLIRLIPNEHFVS